MHDWEFASTLSTAWLLHLLICIVELNHCPHLPNVIASTYSATRVLFTNHIETKLKLASLAYEASVLIIAVSQSTARVLNYNRRYDLENRKTGTRTQNLSVISRLRSPVAPSSVQRSICVTSQIGESRSRTYI